MLFAFIQVVQQQQPGMQDLLNVIFTALITVIPVLTGVIVVQLNNLREDLQKKHRENVDKLTDIQIEQRAQHGK